jgi:hypothetical protein
LPILVDGAVQLKVNVFEPEANPPLLVWTTFTLPLVAVINLVEALFVIAKVPAEVLEGDKASKPKPKRGTPDCATVTETE